MSLYNFMVNNTVKQSISIWEVFFTLLWLIFSDLSCCSQLAINLACCTLVLNHSTVVRTHWNRK